MEYNQSWKKMPVVCSCCWWWSILTSRDVLIPDHLPKILPQGQKNLMGKQTRQTASWQLLVPQHTTVHYRDLQEPRSQQVPAIVLSRGQDASRGCSSPSRPLCSSHLRFSSFRSHFFFIPRALSAAVPAFRLLWCVLVLAFVIIDFSQYCTSALEYVLVWRDFILDCCVACWISFLLHFHNKT